MSGRKCTPYLCIFPIFFLLAFFLIYPIVLIIYSSFFEVPLNLQMKFVGLNNYIQLLSDSNFIYSLKNSIYFVGGSVAGQCGFGFLLAILLKRKIKGTNFYRTIFMIPWLLSDVIIGIMFILLFTSYGTINSTLLQFGIQPINWLTTPELAMFVVTLANIWKSTSFYMFLNSAGLATIQEELYESAQIDGASLFQRFRFITIPLVKPFLMLSILYSTITTYNYFGVIYVITYGGPLNATAVPAFYMYRAALEWGEIGYASAIGMFILIINLIFLSILMKLKLLGSEMY